MIGIIRRTNWHQIYPYLFVLESKITCLRRIKRVKGKEGNTHEG